MPRPALPVPRPVPPTGTHRHRREFRDALGTPLPGTATITGRQQHGNGEQVTLGAVPVAVDLVAGVLEVDLPADTYDIAVVLTPPRALNRHTVQYEVTLPEATD
jgi:hypothetical protein